MKEPGPGGMVQVWKAEREKEIYLLPGTEKIQVDGGRNYHPTSFNLASLVLFQKEKTRQTLHIPALVFLHVPPILII
jgi:hypothetical protein